MSNQTKNYRILMTFEHAVGSPMDADIQADIYACDGKVDSGFDIKTRERDIAGSFDSFDSRQRFLARLLVKYPDTDYRLQDRP